MQKFICCVGTQIEHNFSFKWKLIFLRPNATGHAPHPPPHQAPSLANYVTSFRRKKKQYSFEGKSAKGNDFDKYINVPFAWLFLLPLLLLLPSPPWLCNINFDR